MCSNEFISVHLLFSLSTLLKSFVYTHDFICPHSWIVTFRSGFWYPKIGQVTKVIILLYCNNEKTSLFRISAIIMVFLETERWDMHRQTSNGSLDHGPDVVITCCLSRSYQFRWMNKSYT